MIWRYFNQLVIGNTASTIASDTKNWIGGIIITDLVALVIALTADRVNQLLSLHYLKAPINDLVRVLKDLSDQVELLQNSYSSSRSISVYDETYDDYDNYRLAPN